MSADRYVGAVEASDWCTRHAIFSFPKHSATERGNTFQLFAAGSGVKSRPKVNIMYYSRKRWHLVKQFKRHSSKLLNEFGGYTGLAESCRNAGPAETRGPRQWVLIPA